MKIHFSSSIENFDESIDTYRFIRDTILSNGDTIARNWIEEAFEYHKAGHAYSDKETSDIVCKTRKAISTCDVAIFESSIQSFGVGYQAAIANSMQKPILILQKKGTRPLGVMGAADNSLIRKHIEYDDLNHLKEIIISFIKEFDTPQKDLRFNMLLSREILYFLTNESDNTGVSKSQIVRDLLQAEIEEKKKEI